MATQAGAEPSAQSEQQLSEHRASAVEATFTEVIEPKEAHRSGATGPRTPEGKAAVALNAMKHGLATQALVLADEDEDALAALRAAFMADWSPVGDHETKVVERMVAAQWRTERVWRIETGLFRTARASTTLQDGCNEEHPSVEAVFLSGTANHNPLLNCQRYEGGYNREFHLCTRQLLLLQELRRKGLRSPGKPVADAPPLEVKPLGPPVPPAATSSNETGSGKFTEQTPSVPVAAEAAPGFYPEEENVLDKAAAAPVATASAESRSGEITEQTPAGVAAPSSAPFLWKHAGAGKVERQAFLGYRLPRRYDLRLPGSALPRWGSGQELATV